MKKILIGVVILLALGAGYYFYSKNNGGLPGSGTEVSSGMNSLRDLIGASVPQKCTFSSEDAESGKSEGTTYIAGGKVRSDFTNVVSGKTTTSHMITDSKTSYIWEEGQKTGVKMTIEEPEKGEADIPTSTESEGAQTDLDQKMDYKCSAWLPDSSLFNPPSDVTFTDLSEMFKAPTPAPAASGAGSSDNQSSCSYCNALSGDDKTQCLAALNCN